MNEELLKYQIEKHETRINNHSERIDKLENRQAETNVKIDNLCVNIASLTSAIKWLVGLGASTLLGFFIWAIQSNLLQ